MRSMSFPALVSLIRPMASLMLLVSTSAMAGPTVATPWPEGAVDEANVRLGLQQILSEQPDLQVHGLDCEEYPCVVLYSVPYALDPMVQVDHIDLFVHAFTNWMGDGSTEINGLPGDLVDGRAMRAVGVGRLGLVPEHAREDVVDRIAAKATHIAPPSHQVEQFCLKL